MTIAVHNVYDALSVGRHHHLRSASAAGDERTWLITCSAECEERLLRDVEFSARTPSAVPLTAEETQAAEAVERASQKDVAKMAMALSRIAKDSLVDA